ncbi:hypothetical protein TRFO_27335 [Tritrichomonas foetus]|uniref:RRM domain-containing protein n=1 Tax=Tritrichomonas foetus TaxID=1144522 RepID=A0A1J4K0X0_9EUKA|nr:hypothetical protein TRFO_27335 [Tritrichomonas foetus]|eukprot:OHT05023.1 hypothetical protein TRFO_27335 [Tritrichomonas foetus]
MVNKINLSEDHYLMEKKKLKQGQLKKRKDLAKRTLFLSNIPPRTNNLVMLYHHFKRFGHIDAIYTSGTHASVTFETKEASEAALKSPQTILHNRFIQILYQRPSFNIMADLSSSCDMSIVRAARDEALKNMKIEADETKEIQNSLKKESLERKKAKTEEMLTEYKKGLDNMLHEAHLLVVETEKEDKEDKKETNKLRLNSLSSMINVEKEKVKNLEEKLKVMTETNM